MATTGQYANPLDFREPNWLGQPVSGTDLAKGLLLLRASNMNVIRLQLAMERSDRRIAMEALDGLVALDREIRGFMEEMPPPDPEFSAMARRIDDQKMAIASEKLIFAAGRRGPAIASGTEARMRLEPVAEANVGRSLNRSATPFEPAPETGPCEYHADEEPARRIPWAAILAALLVLLLGAVAAIFGFGIEIPPRMDRLSGLVGE